MEANIAITAIVALTWLVILSNAAWAFILSLLIDKLRK